MTNVKHTGKKQKQEILQEEAKETNFTPMPEMIDEAFKDLCYMVKTYCKIKKLTFTINAKGEAENTDIEYWE